MENRAKILIAEDEITNAVLIKKLLIKAGYSVVVANNGLEALRYIENEEFDAVLTDWMMPHIDGIELIRRLRAINKDTPLIIMVTALVSQDSKIYALESGADDFIAKPIDVNELLARVEEGLFKKNQDNLDKPCNKIFTKSSLSEFPLVAFATSTGGPQAILEILKNIPADIQAAFAIVQQGPNWMLDSLYEILKKEIKLNVQFPKNNTEIKIGTVYIAPGDSHMRISSDAKRIELDSSPKENFVRPSADPLYRSMSESFGEKSIGVILTGLGRDGASGAAHIASVGGSVIIQDPSTTLAPSMPNATIKTISNYVLSPLDSLHNAIIDEIAKKVVK